MVPVLRVSIALAQARHAARRRGLQSVHNELFAAGRGEGATLNGKKISVSKVATLPQPALHGFPTASQSQPNLHTTATSRSARDGVRRDGSAAPISPALPPAASMALEFGLQKWTLRPEFF